MLESKIAIINVDVQNDFCPGGRLAVPGGDEVVEPLNNLNRMAREVGALVVFTRDWHPKRTSHFQGFGGVWPEHCVRDTEGAAFHRGLRIKEGDIVVSKGMGEDEDAYSGFEARDSEGRTLHDILIERGVERLIVAGLATEYCDEATILDGLRRGFEVAAFEVGMRAVNIKPADGRRSWEKIKGAGAITYHPRMGVAEFMKLSWY